MNLVAVHRRLMVYVTSALFCRVLIITQMAIANAVLHHLVKSTKCRTLFITHYPLVAAEIEKCYPYDIQNLYMGYTAEGRVDGTRDITFLYRLTKGIASGRWLPYASMHVIDQHPQILLE